MQVLYFLPDWASGFFSYGHKNEFIGRYASNICLLGGFQSNVLESWHDATTTSNISQPLTTDPLITSARGWGYYTTDPLITSARGGGTIPLTHWSHQPEVGVLYHWPTDHISQRWGYYTTDPLITSARGGGTIPLTHWSHQPEVGVLYHWPTDHISQRWGYYNTDPLITSARGGGYYTTDPLITSARGGGTIPLTHWSHQPEVGVLYH